jgi:hypothetical protein
MAIIGEPLSTFLKRLAMVAMGLSAAGGLGVASQLAIIPARAVEDVIDDSEEPEWDERDRLRVLHLLAFDPRVSVRRHVAMSMAARPDAHHAEEAETLVARLAIDSNPEVRMLAVHDLLALLAHQSPLERAELVCRWALDGEHRKRLAIAVALRTVHDVNGAFTALEHLSHDASPDVRSAAALALAVRRA